MIRICEICGAEYETQKTNQKYCGAECRKKADAKNHKEWRECNKGQQVIKRKKKVNQDVIDIARAAREAGMTYGQYVVMMERGAR